MIDLYNAGFSKRIELILRSEKENLSGEVFFL